MSKMDSLEMLKFIFSDDALKTSLDERCLSTNFSYLEPFIDYTLSIKMDFHNLLNIWSSI